MEIIRSGSLILCRRIPILMSPFAENLMLSLCLHVEFDDGAEKKILTDTSWKIAPHMIESSNVFGSETVNGEKRIKDWNTIICDDSGWASATLLKEDEMPKTLLKTADDAAGKGYSDI